MCINCGGEAMKLGKYVKLLILLFLSFTLSIGVLGECMGEERIKIPLSEPQPHPQLARMQSLSPKVVKGVTYFGSGKRYQKHGVIVAILKGDPYEMGYSRGVLFKNEIREEMRECLYLAHKLNFENLMTRCREMEKFIPKEYKEELIGLSAGSGIDYQVILLSNTLNSISRDMACTSVAVKGADGKLLRSRNWDWTNYKLLKDLVLIIYKPAQGYAFASLSLPYLIGVITAMNEQGLTLGFHSINMSSTQFLAGTPIFILTRHAIQYADSIKEAGKILADSQRCEPMMWMVTNSEGARIYEFNDQKIAFKDMTEDHLILTGHTQVLLDIGSPYITSIDRYNDAESFLTKHKGKMDLKKLIDLNRISSISWVNYKIVENLHSAIFKSSTLDFWIAIDPPPATKGKWIGFNLKNELYDQGN